MRPTLDVGDWILALPPRWLRPRAGRIAVCRDPREGGLMVKRLLSREPGGGWYVIGDTPSRSTDSRHFGAVSEERVEGVAWCRYGPRRGWDLRWRWLA